MSILPYCDYRLLVHRHNQETPDRDEYLDVVPDWQPVPVPAGLNGTLQRNPSGAMDDRGPGEIQATVRHWYLLPGFDVRERDVLEVVSGPAGGQEVGRFYRVEEARPATGPIAIHHWEVLGVVTPALATESEGSS